MYESKSLRYKTLVDSGADFCIFHGDVANYLGISVRNGKKLQFHGTSGTTQVAYFHTVEIELTGHRVALYCGFSEDMDSLPYGILGQTGFFDTFTVEFDYRNKCLELKPKH